jgi:hypothetical protein
MLAAISGKIAEAGMSIESISTELRMTRSGRQNFTVTAECTTTMPWDQSHITDLTNEFSTLKESLSLEIMDIRVHSAA